jgi:hypothetical protein
MFSSQLCVTNLPLRRMTGLSNTQRLCTTSDRTNNATMGRELCACAKRPLLGSTALVRANRANGIRELGIKTLTANALTLTGLPQLC